MEERRRVEEKEKRRGEPHRRGQGLGKLICVTAQRLMWSWQEPGTKPYHFRERTFCARTCTHTHTHTHTLINHRQTHTHTQTGTH